MQLTETQETLLRKVLGQLVTSYTVTAEELSATHAYLFGDATVAPFFTDTELFETVEYLRDLALTLEVKTLEELADYYDHKKAKLRSYVEEKTVVAPVNAALNEAVMGGDFKIHVSDGMFATAAAFDMLNSQINTVSLNYWESVSKKMTYFFQPLSLPSFGETDVHAVVKKYVKELIVSGRQRSAHRDLAADVSLPLSMRHYVEQFASQDNQVCFIQLKTAWENTGLQQWMSECRDLYSSETFDSIWGNTSARRMPDYTAIIEVLKQEKPIEDISFKMLLTEWLVYSKMVVSHSGWHDTVQPAAKVSYSAVNNFFGNGCVRVYGYMREWVKRLYTARLSHKKWVILKRRENHFWMTSDNPGFVINMKELKSGFTEFIPRHSLSDIQADSLMYYPLSKDYCLRLEPIVESREEEDDNVPIDYEEPSEEELEFVNGITVSTYKKVLITNQRETLEQIQA